MPELTEGGHPRLFRCFGVCNQLVSDRLGDKLQERNSTLRRRRLRSTKNSIRNFKGRFHGRYSHIYGNQARAMRREPKRKLVPIGYREQVTEDPFRFRGNSIRRQRHAIRMFPVARSSGRAPLLAPSPLRTGLEGFPFIRLEHPKTPP